MKTHLFTYGTLLSSRYFSVITGTQCYSSRGLLKGYVRRQVKDAEYPAIIPDENSSVLGMVYHDVPENVLRRLDMYEGNMYERATVKVRLEDGSEKDAFAYVIKEDFAGRLQGGWTPGPEFVS